MSKHRTPEQWQALVDQQRDSGLSASQFCIQQNIGYANFCKWRNRLSSLPTPLVVPSASSDEASFLDLSSLIGAPHSSGLGWNIVLSLGNGVELRLSQNG
jgi:putative transposase